MDFDVFGSSEEKVVIFGEDNVVIVKDKEAERVSNEEIPQAISELKIEPSNPLQELTITESADPTSAALGTPTKQEIKDDTSPTKAKSRSKKRDTPSKEELLDYEDATRSIRSSRAKIVNYYETPQKVVEETTKTPSKSKPKSSKKAEREAAIKSGVKAEKMIPLEVRELPEFVGDEEPRYLELRNNVLRLWHANTAVQLTKAHVIENVHAKHHKSVDRVFNFLERYPRTFVLLHFL